MTELFEKIYLGGLAAIITVMPVFANSTDIGIQADVEELVSLQLERTDTNAVVSDDLSSISPVVASNEVLNFGGVNPLALSSGSIVSRNLTSANGTVGTIKAMVIDTAGKIYKADGSGSPLPKATNDGAIYFVENSLQLRVVRAGATPTAISVSNTGSFRVLVEDASTYNFADGSTINTISFLDKVGTTRAGGLTTVDNNVPFPLDLGIHVPFSQIGGNAQTTVITFTGI
jgi:hypothetical protein